MQEPQIALELAGTQRRVLVADVMDDDVRPADVAADLLHARQDLLVDAVFPAELRIGEEADVVHFGFGGGRCRVGTFAKATVSRFFWPGFSGYNVGELG